MYNSLKFESRDDLINNKGNPEIQSVYCSQKKILRILVSNF